eukprot:gene2593-3299_t
MAEDAEEPRKGPRFVFVSGDSLPGEEIPSEIPVKLDESGCQAFGRVYSTFNRDMQRVARHAFEICKSDSQWSVANISDKDNHVKFAVGPSALLNTLGACARDEQRQLKRSEMRWATLLHDSRLQVGPFTYRFDSGAGETQEQVQTLSSGGGAGDIAQIKLATVALFQKAPACLDENHFSVLSLVPQLSALPEVSASFYLDDLKPQWQQRRLHVAMHLDKPLAEGSRYMVYEAQNFSPFSGNLSDDKACVVKRHQAHVQACVGDPWKAYLEDVQRHHVAHTLLAQFSQKCLSPRHLPQFLCPRACVIMPLQRPYQLFILEQLLNGRTTDAELAGKHHDMMDFFGHWTLFATNDKLLVTGKVAQDQQGRLLLRRPTVSVSGYLDGNMAREQFMAHHQCNSLCMQARLPRHNWPGCVSSPAEALAPKDSCASNSADLQAFCLAPSVISAPAEPLDWQHSACSVPQAPAGFYHSYAAAKDSPVDLGLGDPAASGLPSIQDTEQLLQALAISNLALQGQVEDSHGQLLRNQLPPTLPPEGMAPLQTVASQTLDALSNTWTSLPPANIPTAEWCPAQTSARAATPARLNGFAEIHSVPSVAALDSVHAVLEAVVAPDSLNPPLSNSQVNSGTAALCPQQADLDALEQLLPGLLPADAWAAVKSPSHSL